MTNIVINDRDFYSTQLSVTEVSDLFVDRRTGEAKEATTSKVVSETQEHSHILKPLKEDWNVAPQLVTKQLMINSFSKHKSPIGLTEYLQHFFKIGWK